MTNVGREIQIYNMVLFIEDNIWDSVANEMINVGIETKFVEVPIEVLGSITVIININETKIVSIKDYRGNKEYNWDYLVNKYKK